MGKSIGKILGLLIGFIAVLCVITLVWGAAQMSKGSITDTLTSGCKYTAEIVAVSAYHYKSEKITLEFTAE